MKDTKRCISIVIPVFNEIFTIKEIIRRVTQSPWVSQIVIIDDGSTDGTTQALKKIESEYLAHPSDYPYTLKILYSPKNQGKGASLRKGFQYVTAPITIIQDADLEYDPVEYPKLIQPILEGIADVVYGSRFAGYPRRVLLFWHTIGNKLITFFCNMLTNLNLTDIETGYKVFRTDVLKLIPIRSNRFGFEPEVTVKVAGLGCRIYEVPISYRGRTYAEGKKINWKDGLKALLVILRYTLFTDLGELEERYRLRAMQKAYKYNRWMFDQIRPYIGQKVLEIGSGIGNFSKYLLDREQVFMTDVSERFLEELNALYGEYENVRVSKLDITQDPASNELPKDFDTILCFNVLEHIQDDLAALRHMYKFLREGGKLLMYVPAHRGLYSRLDHTMQHYRRYESWQISALLERAGFKVISVTHHNALAAIGWWVQGKLIKHRGISTLQTKFFNLMVPVLNVEKRLSLPFGLTLLVVAEKPCNKGN